MTDIAPTLALASPLWLSAFALVAARRSDAPTAWRLARVAASGNTLLALGLVAGSAAAAAGGTRLALPVVVVLPLVAFLGLVLVRYGEAYLAGRSGQQRFVGWLLATLAGASLVVGTPNLGVLVLAWFATSLSLQRLLTFCEERPGARLAAHKKFLVSRVADLCMLTAAGLLFTHAGSLDLAALATMPAPAAAVPLIAIACLLKTAQLPVHGWLMQVMEAPTPVSALLHAGVVNLGGVVLIRTAPLLQTSAAAQALLVVVGTLTAVIAGLVHTTRPSVKSALAWSTCAQMGFMVLQCGLGLYELALLHLVAHSLYKAHAFLRAGSAVGESVAASLLPTAAPTSWLARFGGLAASVVLTFSIAHGLGVELWERPELFALAGVVSLALAPWFTSPLGVATAAAIALGYFAVHRGLHGCLCQQFVPAPASNLAAGFVLAAFTSQFLLHAALTLAPGHVAVRRLHTWLRSGLYLDERLTRATLRLWPIPRSPLAS